MCLNEVPINTVVKIESIDCMDFTIKRRLLDLGFVPNSMIKPIFSSPFNNPIAYEVKNTVIALRKEDSKFIRISI